MLYSTRKQMKLINLTLINKLKFLYHGDCNTAFDVCTEVKILI